MSLACIPRDIICNPYTFRHRFGDDKIINFTKPFEQNRLVVRKRIRSQWSDSNSTIICICTIAYEDYIIYSSV